MTLYLLYCGMFLCFVTVLVMTIIIMELSVSKVKYWLKWVISILLLLVAVASAAGFSYILNYIGHHITALS